MDTLANEILTFRELMTGGMPLHYWFALWIFYMIGATIYQSTKVSKGIETKSKSPDKFDPLYFIKDRQNYIDFLVATLSAYVFLRFADKVVNIEKNIEWLLLVSVALGTLWQLLADKLIDWLRKFFKKMATN